MEAHKAVMGKHRLTDEMIFQLGFACSADHGDWSYAHLCYIEAILRVSIYVLGLKTELDDYWSVPNDELLTSITQPWETPANLSFWYGWGRSTVNAKDFDWHPLTHQHKYEGLNDIAVPLVPRFEPSFEALMEMPTRYMMLTQMHTANGAPVIPPMNSIDASDSNGAAQLYVRGTWTLSWTGRTTPDAREASCYPGMAARVQPGYWRGIE